MRLILFKEQGKFRRRSGFYVGGIFRRLLVKSAIARRVAVKTAARGVKALGRSVTTSGALCLAEQRFFTRNTTPNNGRTVPKKAVALLKKSTRLVSPYLYETQYQPTQTELDLLAQLSAAYHQAHAYTKHIAEALQQRKEGRKTP